ncbi:MAG: efflux RND transporter periplasmic adaptor subunit [Acidobacteria bacterium]|nr:efflux RND transporter periplasmic adaptor subunit [Acidobacteriota bacterium]
MAIDKKALDDLRIDRGDEEPRSPAGRWVAAGVLTVILLAAVWGFAARNQAPEVTVEEAVALNVGGSADAATVLNANGYVTARRAATVSSKVTGRVTAVLVEEGMVVEEGEILARIDPATPEAALRLAQAQARATESALRETEVRIEEARLDLERAERLARERVASQQDLDRARTTLRALQARLETQRDDLSVALRQVALRERDLDDTIIRAPFGGVVVSKNAQEGEMISPMSAGGSFTRTGICTIVDMSSLEIEVDVNEAYINRVTADQRVVAVLDAYPDWEIPGHVIAVIPTADRQKATVRVRIALDVEDARILPDMGVKVRFIAEEDVASTLSSLTSLPGEAVRRDGESDIVFVVRDGRVERRAVNVASRQNERVLVRAGVSPGERVVTSSEEALEDGMEVEVREGEER